MLMDHTYEIYDLPEIEHIEELFQDPELKGLNVTIPYKQKIIPYLDALSPEAEKTGVVNCISIQEGKKTGYNADVYGFEKTLLLHHIPQSQKALILGDGGAAKAVKFVLEKHGISFDSVSRKGSLSFDKLDAETVENHHLIVQCTPVGTFPETDSCLIFPFDGITAKHLVIDLIYNPPASKFIRNASAKGAKTVNGLYMLEQQAEKSWEIWSS